jgi:CubicO group peptidase (beta-lactamase class C family)
VSTTALSKPGLERMERVLAGYVARREVAGMVAVVHCRDEEHVITLGTLALDDPAPIRSDAIFRIASLTKPITAVAAMMLVEECRVRLDDPIDPWIPELANRRVLRSVASELDDTVPADRAITVRDLLTYRMGFGSVMAAPDTYPIQRKVREYRLGGDGPPRPALGPSTDEWLTRLGSLPLLAQPGTRWLYNTSADVLGILVARVTGMPFGRFLQERIFEPLGMDDTAFTIGADKLDRFATSYAFDRVRNALEVYDGVTESAWATAPFESGGGGLVGTAGDYLAFCRMMLHKGATGRGRLLSRAAVEMMTSDQLRPSEREGAEIFFGDSISWGFGMAVDIRRDQLYRTPGRFGWDGGLGTTAYTDPQEAMIGILFTHRAMESPQPPPHFSDFWNLAYAAML